VHSLTRLLGRYNIEFTFVSPEILRIPADMVNEVRARGHKAEEVEDVREVIADIDVLYVTRVQKERFSDLAEYERVKDHYIVDTDLIAAAKENMALMHPLPRVDEISYGVDQDPRAAYFRQMENGMFIRMALLAAVLGKA